MTRPWLPQQEILAHPKTILFFTHFGMHGALEAIWYGVPMVGFPLFSDQAIDYVIIVLYRVAHLVASLSWVGLTLILLFLHSAPLPSCFCQISISLGRIGLTVEQPKSKSTQIRFKT